MKKRSTEQQTSSPVPRYVLRHRMAWRLAALGAITIPLLTTPASAQSPVVTSASTDWHPHSWSIVDQADLARWVVAQFGKQA